MGAADGGTPKLRASEELLVHSMSRRDTAPQFPQTGLGAMRGPLLVLLYL